MLEMLLHIEIYDTHNLTLKTIAVSTRQPHKHAFSLHI